MRQKSFLFLIFAVLTIFVVTACGGGATATPTPRPPTATPEPTEEPTATPTPTEEATPEITVEATAEAAMAVDSVCLVTDIGRVNDGTFNEYAYNGMVRAEKDFDLQTRYIETTAQTDYAKNINTCVQEGFDVIVTVGFLITDATLEAATANPDRYFIGVDQYFEGHPDNLVGIQYREDQAGFLVGAMAALMSEKGTIAGVYGIPVPAVVKFRHGYEMGARYINPDIKVLGVYIDDFNAPDRGATAAEQLIGEGADIMFGAGGRTGSGGIKQAAADKVLVIGVDQDEYFTTFEKGNAPGVEYLITSALKRVDVGVYDMLGALAGGEQTWLGGGIYTLEAANDGIGFAEAHDAEVPEDVTARVQEIFDMMKAGTLDTGVDAMSGAFLDTSIEVDETILTAEPPMEMTAEATPEATATPKP